MTSSGRAEAREGIRTITQGAKLDEIKDRALEALKETTAILDTKSPGESKAFKNWLAQIAEKVAEAGTEGGSSALVVSRSATKKKRRWRKSPRFWASENAKWRHQGKVV